MNRKLLGYLRLMRPANLPTASADILAGAALAGLELDRAFISVGGEPWFPKILYLCLASAFLYASGVVLNDVFDRDIDRVERPERPIPSGVVSVRNATWFGILLALIGIFLAFLAGMLSGMLALGLAIAILVYDGITKKYAFFGPLTMASCRGLNLLLGMSIAGSISQPLFALIPVTYIFAVTVVSRGEVHGNNKNNLILAAILYAAVIFAVVNSTMTTAEQLASGLPFLLIFTGLIYWPLLRAYRQNSPENIKKAVMAGVLSIILLDATLSAAMVSWWYGTLVVVHLPLSLVLSRIFAVT